MPDSPARTATRARATPSATTTPVGPPIPRGLAARRARPAPASAATVSAGRATSLLLVAALVLGTLWLDGDRHDPVPAYGIVFPPGVTSYPALNGSPEAGDAAPTFLLPATDGEVIALSDRRGEVVVLHFWTTWCLECRDDIPGLSDLAGEGVTVFGIDVGEPMSRAGSAANNLGIAYPVLVDADAEVALTYGVTEYPATVVIDADGVIRAITYGPVPIAALAEQVAAAGAT